MSDMTEYDRGRAEALAEAVKWHEAQADLQKRGRELHPPGSPKWLIHDEIATAHILAAHELRALSTSPGEHVLVTRDELSEWSKCLHDVASGKGGWAWEDVFYEMSDRAMLSAEKE